MKNKFDNEMLTKIKNILLKKSEGYFYNEEVLEYQSKADFSNDKEKQITFLSEENNEKEKLQDVSSLTLIKKKVTTHYVPPDLLAVKMLVEIFGEKVTGDDLSNLSDDELNMLKQEILKKLENV